MSRLTACFEALRAKQRKALIPYITAGDPTPEITVPLLHALVAAGADIVELGVPFSDPMADGPVIQRATERALVHRVTLQQVLELVRAFRATNAHTPLVLMGYLNPVEIMGYQAFAQAAQAAGVDGVLTVDLPPEEAAELVTTLTQHQLDPIFLLSPTTTPARMAQICAHASGFVYYVSLKGVTGAGGLDMASVAAQLAEIRKHTTLPVGVGFGIQDPQTAAQVAKISDAVVVGSALVRQIETLPEAEIVTTVPKLLQAMREQMDA